MKIYLSIITLFAIQLVVDARELCLVNDDSFTGLNLRKECSYSAALSAVRKQLVRGCERKEKELMALLGVDNEDDAEDAIDDICADAKENMDVTDFDTIVDVEGSTSRFYKEYYNGNTYFNEQIQQNGRDKYNVDSGRQIKQFYKNTATKGAVSWPEDEVLTNFDDCDINAVMCCWVQDRVADGDGNGNCEKPYTSFREATGGCIDKDPADNTDVCYVDHAQSDGAQHVPGGFTIFDEATDTNSEGDAHCHGFAWSDDDLDPSVRYKGNNLFYVSFYDHLRQRGYVREVPGAPMCACLDKMPVVTRSDCTEIDVKEAFELTYNRGSSTFDGRVMGAKVSYNDCGELAEHIEDVTGEDPAEYLVGDGGCPDATKEFLASYGIEKI